MHVTRELELRQAPAFLREMPHKQIARRKFKAFAQILWKANTRSNVSDFCESYDLTFSKI